MSEEPIKRGRGRPQKYSGSYKERRAAADVVYRRRLGMKERIPGDTSHNRWRSLIDTLKSIPCMDCGGLFPPEAMDFDHVRGKKLFQIATSMGISLDRLEAELAKCDLVCANCHRIRTRKRHKR